MTAPTSEKPLKVVPPDTSAPDDQQLAPPPVAADPEPETIDPDPEVLDPNIEDATGTEVVQRASSAIVSHFERFDASIETPDWPYEFVEFMGDKIAIRVPKKTALAGFYYSGSRHVDDEIRTDLSNYFIAKHVSKESFGRVMSRMIDPDEDDYTMETIGELFSAVVNEALSPEEREAVRKAEAENEAKAKALEAKSETPGAAIT